MLMELKHGFIWHLQILGSRNIDNLLYCYIAFPKSDIHLFLTEDEFTRCCIEIINRPVEANQPICESPIIPQSNQAHVVIKSDQITLVLTRPDEKV